MSADRERSLGFRTVRGVSGRGAAKGLEGLIRAATAGNDLRDPDGPAGRTGAFKARLNPRAV